MKKTSLSAALAAALALATLPAAAQVESYIDAPKGAYIDTGFKPDSNTRVVMDVDVQGAGEYWFGAWNVAWNNGAFAVCNDGGNVYVAYGSGDQCGGNGSVVPSGRHTIDFDKGVFKVDGNVHTTRTGTFGQLNYNLYLFAQNRSGTAGTYGTQGTIRCYSCQIYDDGTLVRDFVPTDDPDFGFRDLVSGEFFGNRGSGTMQYTGNATEMGTWYDSSWQSGFTPAEGNILIYRTPDPATGLDQREGTLGYAGLTDGEAVANNKYKTTALVDNASLTYTLAKATAIDEVRIRSTWGNGTARSFVSITSIQIVTFDGETNTIGRTHKYVDYTGFSSLSTLKMDDGSPLCEDAHKIIFNFGTQDYGYNGYAELEVVGHAVEGTLGIPYWSTGSWKDSGFTPAPAATNLILGKAPSYYSGLTVVNWASRDANILTDGDAETNILSKAVCLWSDSVFTYTLDAESVIDEVRIYSSAGDGYRDELRVASVVIETLGGKTNVISGSAVSSYDAWPRGCPYAVLKMSDGGPLCTNAVRITFNFGPQKSSYVHYSELEVLGRVAEGGVYLPQWHTGSWKESGFTPAPAATNLILGKAPSHCSGLTVVNWASRDPNVLTDGDAETNILSKAACLWSDSVFTYTLDAESVISEVRIYSTGSDGARDELHVESIVIETRGGATNAISPGAVTKYDAHPSACPYAVLKKADGSPLCTDAVRITFNFGPQKSSYVHYSELEVLGRVAEGGMSMLQPEWVTSLWNEGFTPAPAATNLILGKTPDPAQGLQTAASWTKPYSALTDGAAVAGTDLVVLLSYASVTYTLDAPSVIEEVKIYCTSSSGDGWRNDLHVSSVVVETPGGATITISPGEIAYSDPGNGPYCPAATLKMPDGSPICRNASKITINFGPAAWSYMYYSELEVIGYANSGPLLGLATSAGTAKRILEDDFTLGLVATLDGVAGTTFDWDLDGDGIYEIIDGAATMEVAFTNINARTVRVRDTSTWQVESLDIGAYPTDVYVAPEGQGGDEYPYGTPATAANTPDAVWPLVIPGSRVHLLPGAYNYSFTIGEGVHLMADAPSPGATVVTNDNTRRIFEVSGQGAVISGITMSGGKVVQPSSGWAADIPATQADAFPGGACVYVHDGGTVSNCWISAPNCNLRGGAGGCIYSDDGRVVDCVIGNYTNTLDIFYGTGIYQKGADALVERCVITNIVMTGPHSNTKHKMGGAIQMTGGTVRNCLITGCAFPGATSAVGATADRTPGILAGAGRIENCTIAGNAAWFTAAGIVTYGDATVANSIMYGNTSNSGANPDAFAYGGNGTFLKCCTGTAIGGNGSASGNFIANPRFTDAAGGDFSLVKGSPCRNKADRALYTGDLAGIDLAHASRLDGPELDIGCYEYQNHIRPTIFIMR